MANKTTSKPRRKYDSIFKADVVKMALSGRPVREIADSLGISENLIYRWRNEAQNAADNEIASESSKSQSEEILRLRAQLNRTEQERDILKKALGIFSRGN